MTIDLEEIELLLGSGNWKENEEDSNSYALGIFQGLGNMVRLRKLDLVLSKY